MNFFKITVASIALMAAGSVSAATLSFTGTGQSQIVAGNDLGLGIDGNSIDFITGDLKSAANGLSVNHVGSGDVKLTFTYLGFEAGNSNYSAGIGGGSLFTNGVSTVGDTVNFVPVPNGLIDFSFGTTAPAGSVGDIFNNGVANPASRNFAIGYHKLSDTSYYVFFDDIAQGDRDFDDIGMRIDVSTVPLPAAGWMLLAGVGGLFAAKRRKKA